MTIVSSSLTEGVPQADGRRYVTETHVDHTGAAHRFEYLAAPDVDCAAIMAARARVAEMRASVLQTIPDAVPLIQALHAEGLIEGWRAVTYVGPPREMPNAYCGPLLRGDEMNREDKK